MSKVQSFLNKITPGIVSTCAKHKILPSLVIAQAALETGWGTSELATKAKNLFGLKANNTWKGPTYTKVSAEHLKGQKVSLASQFRKYDTWSSSIVDHAKHLTSQPRYKSVVDEYDYQTACFAILAAGYATDPLYASKLINIIERNNLIKYDKQLLNEINSTHRKERT